MKETEISIHPLGAFSFNLAELWGNRELLYFFAWRDIKVKYKQTYPGVLWAILQPLLLTPLASLERVLTLELEKKHSHAHKLSDHWSSLFAINTQWSVVSS
ncbi:MAG: hypothetical protein JNK14_13330 [Chitinophagaceae bacterium]|nr:hypothetical protein [Chitinophagaceae bacterium]